MGKKRGSRRAQKAADDDDVEDLAADGRMVEEVDEEELLREDFERPKGLLEEDDDDDDRDDSDEEEMNERNAHVLRRRDSDEDEDSEEQGDDSDDEVEVDETQLPEFLRKARKSFADEELEQAEQEYFEKSLQAWGRDKTTLYGTNFVDPDFATDSEEERQQEEEEEEAMLLQQREADELNEDDYGLATAVAAKPKATKKKASKKAKQLVDLEQPEVIPRNVDSMSSAQKLKLLATRNPELTGLLDELASALNELDGPLGALPCAIDEDKPEVQSSDTFQNNLYHQPLGLYAQYRIQLLTTFAMNVAFYSCLVAKGVDTTSHPCISTLVKLKKMINKLAGVHDQVKDRLVTAAAAFEDDIARWKKAQQKKPIRSQKKRKADVEVSNGEATATASASAKRAKGTKASKARKEKIWSKKETELETELGTEDAMQDLPANKGPDEEDAAALDAFMAKVKEAKQQRKAEWLAATAPALPEDDGRDETVDGARAVSYQILKNKGLLPSRKKEYRNPRVRNKKKFVKAQKRRVGQAREAFKEVPAYAGEATGIKRAISRSVKLS